MPHHSMLALIGLVLITVQAAEPSALRSSRKSCPPGQTAKVVIETGSFVGRKLPGNEPIAQRIKTRTVCTTDSDPSATPMLDCSRILPQV